MKRAAALASCLLCLAAPALGFETATGREIAVTAAPVSGPARSGPLEFLGGAALSSADPEFGGLSGLQVRADGRLVAVSGRGHLLEATVARRDSEPGLALERARLFEFPRGQADGRNFQLSVASTPARCRADRPRGRSELYDAEAVAALGDDLYAVAYERNHRIQCYRRLDGPGDPPRLALEPCPASARRADAALALAASGAVRQVEGDCGIKALAFGGTDGALLMLSERPGPGRFAAWAFRGDDLPYPLRYRLAPIEDEAYGVAFRRLTGAGSAPATPFATEWRPADAALLGDDLLVLERYPLARGGPWAARIVKVEGGARSAAGLVGTCFADLAGFPPVNYEGLAAVPLDAGDALVYVVSDDGEDRRAGTVLLLFRLAAGEGGEGGCAG